jgi:Xaa-Pro aminopeptidase
LHRVTAEEIRNRIDVLRERMRKEGISLYLLTKSDFHMSESTCGYFKALEYITGFTGPEAKLVVTAANAHLWTERQSYIRAVRELKDTGITIHVYGNEEDEICTLPRFFRASGEAILDDLIANNDITMPGEEREVKYVIAFDGRTLPYYLADEIIEALGYAFDSGAVAINAKADLVGEIWQTRPELPSGKISLADVDITGESASQRILRLRNTLTGYGDSAGAVLTALDDIAWLFNIRGTDMEYDRTVMAYAYVNFKKALLFIDERKVNGRTKELLESEGITLMPYNEFYGFLETADDRVIVVDTFKNNSAVVVTVGERKDVSMIHHSGIVEEMKAVKNEIECDNLRSACLNDSVAVIRFIKWLKENAGFVDITEESAAAYLDLLRRRQGATGASMETVCAYGANASMINHTASEGTEVHLEPKGMLMIGAGAQYEGGTTVLTRTVPLGELSELMMADYTLSLAGMLELGDAVFPESMQDTQLDIIARGPLWRYNIDYPHSTGHGVGYMLSANEGPQVINWHKRGRSTQMKAGMAVTNGPGIYRPGNHGVRHENMMLCRSTGTGFLRFEHLTMVPVDTSAVDVRMLNGKQKALLNKYNETVYKKTSPLLTEEEKHWLFLQTRPV